MISKLAWESYIKETQGKDVGKDRFDIHFSDEIRVGDLFYDVANDVYFAISEVDEPYEIYIVTEWVELIGKNDLLIKVGDILMGLTSIIRYAQEQYVRGCVFEGNIKDDVLIMRDFIHKGKHLPAERVGFDGEYQKRFKEAESKRTCWITAHVIGSDSIDESLFVEISGSILDKLEKELAFRAAADSFDKIVILENGILSFEDDTAVFYIEDDLFKSGSSLKVVVDGEVVYEGELKERMVFVNVNNPALMHLLSKKLKVLVY